MEAEPLGSALHIRGARLLDPSTGRDAIADFWVRDGRVIAAPEAPVPGAVCVDATGLFLVPSLIDLHVHLREPGNDAAETIASGTRAAAAGGFGTVVSMPNTSPPTDTPERVRDTIEKARRAGFCRVLPSACMTRDRAGTAPSDLEALAAAGAAVFTDDGSTVPSDEVFRAVLLRARALDRVVMDHAQDSAAERRGVLHAGSAARRLGLPGIPSSAEAGIVARDFRLAGETGGAVHIQHLTSREGVELLREARRAGVRASAEVTPHHLALCDEDIPGDDANWKMNPPLRAPADRDALVEAACDGTLECFATDHAPHTAAGKALGFARAPFGIVGLETAIGVTYTTLVRSGRMDRMTWLRRWTTGPARILDLPPPSLAPGAPADFCLLDLASEWIVDPQEFRSRSTNSPFLGRRLTGRAVATCFEGRWVHGAEEIVRRRVPDAD
jgi:dihydroorotase